MGDSAMRRHGSTSMPDLISGVTGFETLYVCLFSPTVTSGLGI
jgi:hypothetical protein